jgi:phage/conjugal plasmid C-4 type zinc finger TraR family protein
MIDNNSNDFQYNNEEEAEMAQLHSLHIHMNAVNAVQEKLAKQAEKPSAKECVECGEDIPEARRVAVPGCQLCIYCQELNEHGKAIG